MGEAVGLILRVVRVWIEWIYSRASGSAGTTAESMELHS
jgi:hypothetical protein